MSYTIPYYMSTIARARACVCKNSHISSFFSNRKFRLMVEGELSTPRRIGEPFQKFVDSSYYSESELCGGAVTVSFAKYLPWKATHFLQRSTHFSKTCCRPLITPKFLATELPFHDSKSPEIAWGLYGLYGWCSNGVPPIHFFQAEHRIQFRSRPKRFLVFSKYEKGAPKQEISKWSTVCSTFSRSGWSVVRSASLAKWGTSKKRPSPHFHKVPTRSNKVSPRILQKALVQAGVPQGSVLSPTLYSLDINDTAQTPGVYLAIFADDTCIYTTDRNEGYVIRKLQYGHTSMV
jgi:hypothetical protein